MSYIPPWVTSGGGGHYPAHMLPPQHALPTHPQHPPTSSHQQHPTHTPTSAHSPHPAVSSESHVYQAMSPKSLIAANMQQPTTNGTKSDHPHHLLSQPIPSPSSSQSSPTGNATSVTGSNNLGNPQHSTSSASPNHPPPASTPSHAHNPLESPYEPQGFHRNDISPPPKLIAPDLRQDLASQLHGLPELALGIPGTSASADMKAQRKYFRRLNFLK